MVEGGGLLAIISMGCKCGSDSMRLFAGPTLTELSGKLCFYTVDLFDESSDALKDAEEGERKELNRRSSKSASKVDRQSQQDEPDVLLTMYTYPSAILLVATSHTTSCRCLSRVETRNLNRHCSGFSTDIDPLHSRLLASIAHTQLVCRMSLCYNWM